MSDKEIKTMRRLGVKSVGIILIGILLVTMGVVIVLQLNSGSDESSEYVHDGNAIYVNTTKSVKYVGSENCRECHMEIYDAYMKTPTGRSMAKLDTTNIIEEYPQKEAVYDSLLNFYYEMVRRGDRFYQREYRVDKNGNVIHEQWMEAQYVIGSGQNLRMYFYDENGMFYELPLTWYVHKKQWDFSPGYREHGNLRFSRYAGSKCMACHNAHMELSSTAKERFVKPYPLGIGCESCHGPGELHVNQEQGESVSLPSENALTIVNPIKLSPQRQIDVCQQCHLQGKAWALYGEDGWFDFRPGMLLENLWSVYTPAEPEKEAFKVANSAYRFSLSRCFKESHSVATCNTCHDSHGMVQTSAVEFNRQNCQKCHPPESLPGSGSKFAHSAADDCVSCHMKQTGTQNTLHGVMNTDHWIRVDAKQTVIDWSPYRLPAKRQPTMALVPFLDTRDTGKDLRRGIAYLDYFRNYDDRKPYLDSALAYLTIGLTTVGDDARGFLHLGEVQSELELYDAAIKSLLRATELRSEYPEVYYQLGRVYTAVGNLDSALHYYQLAVKYLPDEPSYLEGLGMVLAERGYNDEAVATLEKALRIDKQNPETYAFLGNLYAISLKQPRKALPYFNQRAILDPDIPDVYINLGNTYTLLGDYEEAVKSYQREIYYRPRSVGAFVNLSRVYVVMGRETDAWKALQKAVKIDPSVVMLADFAKLYEERSQKR